VRCQRSSGANLNYKKLQEFTSLTWACCVMVLALVAKSRVERDWTSSVAEIVATMVVLKIGRKNGRIKTQMPLQLKKPLS